MLCVEVFACIRAGQGPRPDYEENSLVSETENADAACSPQRTAATTSQAAASRCTDTTTCCIPGPPLQCLWGPCSTPNPACSHSACAGPCCYSNGTSADSPAGACPGLNPDFSPSHSSPMGGASATILFILFSICRCKGPTAACHKHTTSSRAARQCNNSKGT